MSADFRRRMFARSDNAAKTPQGFLSHIVRPVENFIPRFRVKFVSEYPEVFKGVFLFIEKKFAPLPLIVAGRRRFFVSPKGRFLVRLAFSCSHKGITFSNLLLFLQGKNEAHSGACEKRIMIRGLIIGFHDWFARDRGDQLEKFSRPPAWIAFPFSGKIFCFVQSCKRSFNGERIPSKRERTRKTEERAKVFFFLPGESLHALFDDLKIFFRCVCSHRWKIFRLHMQRFTVERKSARQGGMIREE